jgi:hypothetical protein
VHTRWRSASILAAAVAAAGCGGSHRAAPPRPTLPPALAQRLATLSETVATKLDTGDPCGANAKAKELQQQATAAIARGEVPPPLRSPLLSAAGDLVARSPCVQQAPPEKEHGKDKHKGHKHGAGD